MDEIAAVEWLNTFMTSHASEIAHLGFRWLLHASKHLEDRIEAELRRKR